MADLKINLGEPANQNLNGSTSVANSGNSPISQAVSSPSSATVASSVNSPTVASSAATESAKANKAQEASPLLNIFNKQAEKTSGPKMLESITNKDAALKLKPILGNAPNLQKTLQQDKEYELKKKLRKAQTMLVIVFLIAASSASYFYTQLSAGFTLFGENTSAKLISVNKSLEGLQTQLNKSRYLAAQIDLNRFSFVADEFLDKSSQLKDPNTSEAEKSELTATVESDQLELPKILQRIKDNLGADLTVKMFDDQSAAKMSGDEIRQKFEENLRTALRSDRAELTKDKNNPTNSSDLKLIDNTIKLVGNTKLQAKIKALSVEDFTNALEAYKTEVDPAKIKTFQELISGILDSTKSDLSTISAIKSSRIEWTKIIDEITRVTKDKDVDPYFGTGVYDAVGFEIKYGGYEFDSSSSKIVLSGFTRTQDAKNFTLISKLVDKLEESPIFKKAQMRSFSKNGSEDTGYTANFKIDLELGKDDSETSNKKVTLIDQGLRRRVGGKRVRDLQAVPQ